MRERPLFVRLLGGAGLALLVTLAAAAAGPGAQPHVTPVAPLGPTIEAQPGGHMVWTLAACLDTALARNDVLQAEREKRRELSGQKLQALSNGLPSLDLTGDWSRSRDPSFALDESFASGSIFPTPDVPPGNEWFTDWLAGFGSFLPAPEDVPAQTYYRARASLTWELNPLKILGAVGAASIGIEREEELIRSQEHATSFDVISAYFMIVSVAEGMRSAEAKYRNQAELLDLAKLRFGLGTATRLDTLQAAVALANTEPELRNLRQALANAGARLNAVMGRDPSAPLTIVNELPIETEAIDVDSAVRLSQQRPDLVAMDLSIDLLEHNKQAQKADQRPYLSLAGSYGYVGHHTNTLFDAGHESWAASVAVTVPVFNGLSTKGQVDETKAQIRRTQREIAGTRRSAAVEVRETVNNLNTARENLRAAEVNLDRAEEALSESLLMYELGKASYLDVLDAQSSQLTARRTLIGARYDVLTQTAGLKRSVGYSPAVLLTEIPGLVAAAR